MQRELKFRLWNPQLKFMDYNEDAVLPSLHSEFKGKPGIMIMQFTGLKDKNNNPIYEGDIIKESSSGLFYEINFSDGNFGYASTCLCIDSIDEYEIKVVGDIYQNPELLNP
jgi:hypothetical protein